ncbi:N-6 DNA methylase [uncultured Leptotrichia sp.]|uniref:N-6 DNA methylase n=1 Tax=uncultured Leptotrichia sp. TaxID=159271 RepID=UPI002608CD76|nr:N-6 DNA methylase [uncultured Leptotrichia sp.]
MKNKFFELVTDELENNKNQKKLQILKMSLLLYIICVSKVVYEELEDLRDDNYLFLEYLNNLGFEYDLNGTYLENMQNLSSRIPIFNEIYDFIEEHPDKQVFIESLSEMEMELKLNILRGKYAKITQNYIDNVINLPITRDESVNQLSLDILEINNSEILYSVDFFEENNFYREKMKDIEKNTITEILYSLKNSASNKDSAVILTKNLDTSKFLYSFLKESKKGMIEKDAFYLLKNEEMEDFVKSDKIEYVVAIPFNNTLKNQVIIFNEEKESKNNILFVQSQHFFEKGSEKIKPENYKELVEIIKKKQEINGISKLVSNETILRRKCNLDILGYVFKTKEKVNLEELKQNRDKIFELMTINRKKCDDLVNSYLEEE